jgi:hypothetical protein
MIRLSPGHWSSWRIYSITVKPTLTTTLSVTYSLLSLRTAVKSSSTTKVQMDNYGWLHDYDENTYRWINDRNGADFFDDLSRLATEQAGEEISLKPA